MTAIQIEWLCDTGDHDACDGYACECCARGHYKWDTEQGRYVYRPRPFTVVQADLLAEVQP